MTIIAPAAGGKAIIAPEMSKEGRKEKERKEFFCERIIAPAVVRLASLQERR